MATALFGDKQHGIRISDVDETVTIFSPVGTITRQLYVPGFGLSYFLDEFESLNRKLSGKASFETLEGEFGMTFSVTRLGQVIATAFVRHYDSETRFETTIVSDQTFLEPFLGDLKRLNLSTLDREDA